MTDNVELSPATSTSMSEVGKTQNQNSSEYRTFHQNELNDLMKAQRERGYKKALEDNQQQAAPIQQPVQNGSNVGMGGMPKIHSEEDINRLVEEKLQQQAHLQHGNQIVQQFMGKMMAGKEKYPDFVDKINMLGDLSKIPQIIQLANGVDNTSDMMYDLANNPHKVASLLTLAQVNPHLASIEAQKLSNSIKANNDASNAQNPSAPLSQIKSSVSNDNAAGKKSIAYYRDKYRA